jgi:hypothetical protein
VRSLEDPKVPSTEVTVFLSYLNHWERVATLSLTPSGSELQGSTSDPDGDPGSDPDPGSEPMGISSSDSNHRFKLVICKGDYLSKEFLKIELPTSNWRVRDLYMQSVPGGREFSVLSHRKKR